MKNTLLSMLLVVALVFACGCAEKLTRPRYETIYIGQPAEQVEKTLGKPDATTNETWTYIGRDPGRRAIIKFRDNRVVDKAWYYDDFPQQ